MKVWRKKLKFDFVNFLAQIFAESLSSCYFRSFSCVYSQITCVMVKFWQNKCAFLPNKFDVSFVLVILFFLKNGPIPTSFVYFRPFLITISIIQIEKSVDVVFGIWNRGHEMVGTDETTELWSLVILLIERSLPTPEDLSSNPAISNFIKKSFILLAILKRQKLINKRGREWTI